MGVREERNVYLVFTANLVFYENIEEISEQSVNLNLNTQ